MTDIGKIITGETDPISAMEFLESSSVSILPKGEGGKCFGVGSVTPITEEMFKNFAEHAKDINTRMGRDSGKMSDISESAESDEALVFKECPFRLENIKIYNLS